MKARKIFAAIIAVCMLASSFSFTSAYAVYDEILTETTCANTSVQSTSSEKSNCSTVSAATSSKYLNVNTQAISGGANSKTSWIDAPYYGVAMIDQAISSTNAYYFQYSKGQFGIISDFFSDGLCYGQMFSPANQSTGDFYRFNAGESFFVNYDVIKTFDNATSSIIYHENPVEFAIYIFGGKYSDNSSSGSGLTLMGSYLGSTRCSFKLTAPQSDWIYRFFVAIPDTTMVEFGGWLSLAFYGDDYKDLVANDKIDNGDTVTVNLGSMQTDFILDNDFVLTYAKAYEIELTANVDLAACMSSSQNVGGHLYLADENMDVIADTWIGAGAFAFGSTYEDVVLPIMVPRSGTYYIIIGGQCMNDIGNLSCTISDWIEHYEITSDAVFDINVSQLAQTNYTDSEGYYTYEYDTTNDFGCLSLLLPATYNISGNNDKVMIDAYDGVDIVLNSATVGSIWLTNYWAPVSVRCIGQCYLRNNGYFVYTVYNYPSYNSGIYFFGSELNITGPTGIMVENAPVHIYIKKMSAISIGGASGYYLISLWVSGALIPALTLGEGAEFDSTNKIAKMYLDPWGYMLYGYTVSTIDVLYYYGHPDLNSASSSFTLTTEGSLDLLGDVDGDGEIRAVDALILLRYNVGWDVTVSIITGDINGDGDITLTDPLLVLRHVTGWSLPYFD